MTVIAVAALSARMLAQAAAEVGHAVVALDLFGDADTRAAATRWISLGDAAALRLDGARLLAALAELARRGDVLGWVAGSGFEGQPELLERGAALLPLIGTSGDAVRRVRDPKRFFARLDALGVEHPAVRWTAPDDPAGWLVKDASACGGAHIRRADVSVPLPMNHYFQREVAGVPMSATFIANGRAARVLGYNLQTVRPMGDEQPCVFHGVIGPVPLADAVTRHVSATVNALTAFFGLRGYGSLDFMLDGAQALVLEVNPRPPASWALYGPRPMAAQLRACLHGDLTDLPTHDAGNVRGIEIVYAPRALRLDDAARDRLAARPGCHDLPAAAIAFAAGEPVCSVSASGPSVAAVRAGLARGRAAALHTLEL